MITSEEMAVVDENAAALGVPRKQLMESSGNAVARTVRELADPGAHVTIVAGRGNNGGDSFVTARFLDNDYDVTILLLGRKETIRSDIARENWDALQHGEYDAREVRDSRDFSINSSDVIIDAMLGTGVTGDPREPERSAIEEINASDATVVAVDVPSGIDVNTGEAADVASEADHVVTFHDSKPGLGSLDATVTVADIGIPAMADTIIERGDLSRLGRNPDSHKGENGEVLVVGGGPFTGAPALTAQAAFGAGADLVNVACPESVAATIQSYHEGIITKELNGEQLFSGHVDTLLDIAAEQDVVVLGPGLGTHDDTLIAARDFLSAFDGTCVVDADPLAIVNEVETDATLICTPHAGEFQRMGGDPSDDWRDRMDDVEALAADLDVTILLKGKYDVLSDGDRTRINRKGTPAMAVGGTGDVLAGAIGAFASVLDPIDAAAIGAYANGMAGERAVEGQASITPLDLIDYLPEVIES
jgi:hydroxyethylthiazole kinase-like uncharacterized protein yjeF